MWVPGWEKTAFILKCNISWEHNSKMYIDGVAFIGYHRIIKHYKAVGVNQIAWPGTHGTQGLWA